MTIFDIASIIFFLAVVGFFVRPLLDGMISSGERQRAPSPRSVSESGGYRAANPRPRDRDVAAKPAEDYRMQVDDVESRPTRTRQSGARPRSVAPDRAARLRSRMRDHATVQEAFILKEVLDTPIGLREDVPSGMHR